MRGVWKRFGAVQALADVALAAAPGEIHALVGENGAGKTTLVRILAGLEHADAGTIEVNGRRLSAAHSPKEASEAGVGLVPQHCQVVPGLAVLENLILGQEPTRLGLIRRRDALTSAQAIADRLGYSFDWYAPAETLGLGQRQRLEIVRLLWRRCSVLVLDEPTTVLTAAEVAGLFEVLRSLAAEGRTVILITHKLDEVREVADHVTVLRHGRTVGRIGRQRLDLDELARLMVGELEPPPIRQPVAFGEVRLRLHGVTTPAGEPGVQALRGIDLEVRAGEIVGIAGVEGNGQAELCEVVLGLRQPGSGTVELDGQPINGLGIRARRALGLAFVPADRMAEGVNPLAPLWENVAAPQIAAGRGTRLGILHRQQLREQARAVLTEASVKGDLDLPSGSLSGGNVQRLVVGRELQQPSVVVAAHPTRGVDVRGAGFVHRRLLDLRRAGSAILVISADLDELSQVADRVLVLHRGRIVGGYAPENADPARIGLLMSGVVPEARP
jgi:ABC-type uncharacterized transport system ATPase subunit